jgi:hypothetical protein
LRTKLPKKNENCDIKYLSKKKKIQIQFIFSFLKIKMKMFVAHLSVCLPYVCLSVCLSGKQIQIQNFFLFVCQQTFPQLFHLIGKLFSISWKTIAQEFSHFPMIFLLFIFFSILRSSLFSLFPTVSAIAHEKISRVDRFSVLNWPFVAIYKEVFTCGVSRYGSIIACVD